MVCQTLLRSACASRRILFNVVSFNRAGHKRLSIFNFDFLWLPRRRARLRFGGAGLRLLSLLRHTNSSLSLMALTTGIFVRARLHSVERERRRIRPTPTRLPHARGQLNRKTQAEYKD